MPEWTEALRVKGLAQEVRTHWNVGMWQRGEGGQKSGRIGA